MSRTGLPPVYHEEENNVANAIPHKYKRSKTTASDYTPMKQTTWKREWTHVLERYNLQRLSQEETEDMYRPITEITEIKMWLKTPSKQKSSTRLSMGGYIKHLNEVNTHPSDTVSKKLAEESAKLQTHSLRPPLSSPLPSSDKDTRKRKV